jgi:hypothetical protein
VLRVGEIEEGAEEIQDGRVGRDRAWYFDHLSLAVQEIERYGFEGVAASGDTPAHRAPGTWLRVGAGLEDAKGCAPGGVTRNELVLLIEAVEEPVLEEARA